MPDPPPPATPYLLSVEFPIKEYQAFKFNNAVKLLVGMAEEAGWKLVSACSSVTGAAFPGSIIHLWQVPSADACLDVGNAIFGEAYAALLQFSETPRQEILTVTPYSPTVREVYEGPLRIHYFLWVEILVREGMFDAFVETSTKLVKMVEENHKWALIRAGSPPGDLTRVMHLWEIEDANALFNAMRVFSDTGTYSDLIDCCTRHTQEIYTSMPYNPLGPNPTE